MFALFVALWSRRKSLPSVSAPSNRSINTVFSLHYPLDTHQIQWILRFGVDFDSFLKQIALLCMLFGKVRHLQTTWIFFSGWNIIMLQLTTIYEESLPKLLKKCLGHSSTIHMPVRFISFVPFYSSALHLKTSQVFWFHKSARFLIWEWTVVCSVLSKVYRSVSQP